MSCLAVERPVSNEEPRPGAGAGRGTQRLDEAIDADHEHVVLELLDASACDTEDW